MSRARWRLGYVLANFAIAAAAGAWLYRPFWYELPQSQQRAAEIDYLVRLARTAGAAEQAKWAKAALAVAADTVMRTRVPGIMFRTLDALHSAGVDVGRLGYVCTASGRCWYAAGGDGDALNNSAFVVLLHNPASRRVRVAIDWEAPGAAALHANRVGGDAQQIEVDGGRARQVLDEVLPGSWSSLLVTADVGALRLLDVRFEDPE